MSDVYIIVEGPTEEAFLRRILPPEAMAHAGFVVAPKFGGMSSLARSILVMRGKPVIVVMDADTIKESLVQERQTGTEEFIRLADAVVPSKVVMMVPEMEVLFFAAPEVIARMFGSTTPREWLAMGKRDPNWVLQQLAEMNSVPWDTRKAIDLLDAADIDRIRAVPQVGEIIGFLERLRKDGKAA